MSAPYASRWLWCFGVVFVAGAIALMCWRAGNQRRLREQVGALTRGDSRAAIVSKLGAPVAATETAEELEAVVRGYAPGARARIRGRALVYRTSGADELYVLGFGPTGRLETRCIVSRTRSGAQVKLVDW